MTSDRNAACTILFSQVEKDTGFQKWMPEIVQLLYLFRKIIVCCLCLIISFISYSVFIELAGSHKKYQRAMADPRLLQHLRWSWLWQYLLTADIADDIASLAYEDSWNPGIKNTYHCTPLNQVNRHQICKRILWIAYNKYFWIALYINSIYLKNNLKNDSNLK